jgi:hypothetical protein
MRKRGKASGYGPWCRLYASTLDNPKWAKLNDAQFRAWIKMMSLATLNGGMVPDSLDDIAFRFRLPVAKVKSLIQTFVAAHLLERTESGFVIHDWEEMQFDADVSTHRVREFRERQKSKSETLQETELEPSVKVPETVIETVTETNETFHETAHRREDKNREEQTRKTPQSPPSPPDDGISHRPLPPAARPTGHGTGPPPQAQSEETLEIHGFERSKVEAMVVHLSGKR